MPAARTPKSRRTKAHVLDQALQLASRIGFEGLTLGALAGQAGLSKSGLFAHFDSKEDLQIQTLALASRLFVERVLAPAVKAPRGVPRIRRFFDSWMRWIRSDEEPRGDVLIGCAFEFDDAPEGRMRKAVVKGHNAMHTTLERLARQAIDAGEFSPAVDPAQFAFEFLGIVHAYHHARRLLRSERQARRARVAFERLLASCAA
jgi:AcrR family transcriptional regulator